MSLSQSESTFNEYFDLSFEINNMSNKLCVITSKLENHTDINTLIAETEKKSMIKISQRKIFRSWIQKQGTAIRIRAYFAL